MKNVLYATLIAITSLLLAGCENPKVEGNAFVVKGNGDVKPSAGQTVYLIPFDSEAKLYYTSVKNAYLVATSELEDKMRPMCKIAKILIDSEMIKHESFLNTKKSQSTVSNEKCSSFESNIEKMSENIKELKSRHDLTVSEINKKIVRLTKSKQLQITKMASKLKSDALSSITVSFKCGYRYCDQFKFHNKSKYCLKESKGINLYSRGIKVAEGSFVYREELKDKYGFKMDCEVRSGTSEKMEVYSSVFMPNTKTPKIKLLSSEKNLPVDSHGNIIIDKVTVKAAVFGREPVGKKNEDIISYKSKMVDFAEIASKLTRFPEDKKIKLLQTELKAEKTKFKSNSVNKSYESEKNKASLCDSEQNILQETDATIYELELIKKDLSSCTSHPMNTELVFQGVTSLNEKFEAEFDLPLIQDGFIKLVSSNILQQLKYSSSIKKMDTTINGAFNFQDLKKGNYLLFSEYRDSFVEGFWLSPVKVDKEVHFDLNNNSLVQVPYESYLNYQLEVVCNSCTEDEFIRSMLSNDVIEKKYQKNKESMEELTDQLKKLKKLKRLLSR